MEKRNEKAARRITIALDEETSRRLDLLSDDCHDRPESIAASLLHDVLKDDEIYNLEEIPKEISVH